MTAIGSDDDDGDDCDRHTCAIFISQFSSKAIRLPQLRVFDARIRIVRVSQRHTTTAAHSKATLVLQLYSLFIIWIASGKHPCSVAFFSWIYFSFVSFVI